MRIQTLYRTMKGEWRPLRPDSIESRHGWPSPEAYVKECSKRFKHRDPKPYGNGLEIRGDAGTLQRITFED